ncbi:MAG TPA: squalene synthase HpnC [Micromonosporaceae bacterium]
MTSHPGPRGENFPVALRVLPADTRRHLLALYRYARFLDDLGDEPQPGLTGPEDRLAALDEFETRLRALYRGDAADHPVLDGLAGTVAACDLPIEPLLRLVEANRMDQITTRYGTFEQLLEYCQHSADPVGELVLGVFGQATPERIALSNWICTALQIIEHLQDVRQDWRRGRLYLPKEDVDRFGVAPSDLDRPHAGQALRHLVAFEAERARAFLESGAPLVATLTGWARLAVGGYVAGGRAALDALERAGYDPLPGPPRAGKRQIFAAWLRATVRSAG